MIDQARLKELLDYDLETGALRWKSDAKHRFAGRMAGYEFKTPRAKTAYLRVRVGGELHLAHRLVWLWANGSMPPADIDHINGDGRDNRLSNLRAVSRTENLRNMPRYKTNTSGLPGVHWNDKKQRWVAQINKRAKRTQLCASTDFFEAVCARKSAELRLGYHANHGR